MASVVFNGTTFADDTPGSTYLLVGRVRGGRVLRSKRWVEEAVPRAVGIILKDLGTDPGLVQVVFQVTMDEDDVQNWMDAVEGQVGEIGTLTVPRMDSVSNCVLVGQVLEPMLTERVGATLYERCAAFLTFRKTE